MMIASVSLVLSACASTNKKADTATAALPATKPSYDEKVQSLALDKVSAATCPSDSKWESAAWKAIVPLANGCIKAKEWNKVERMGNFLATHAQLTPWGPYYLGMAAESRKDYPRALWMLELALKKDPNEGLFHYELGRIYWELKDDSEALNHLKSASELSPSLFEAHWLMGQLALQRQDNSAAESLFNKALAANPKHIPSYLSLASLHLNTKDYSKAEGDLAQVVALSPQSTKARLALADLQEQQLKKLPEALASYKQIKSLNRDKKLDEAVHVNLDEKIQALEKSMAQNSKPMPPAVRTPSAEKKVTQ